MSNHPLIFRLNYSTKEEKLAFWYIKSMHRKRRSLKLLFFTLLSLSAITYIIFFVSPDFAFPILTFKFPVLILFIALISLFVFSFTTYALKNKKHGFLISLFVLTYILFRLNNLTHPFFLLLLLALFITLELLFSRQR